MRAWLRAVAAAALGAATTVAVAWAPEPYIDGPCVRRVSLMTDIGSFFDGHRPPYRQWRRHVDQDCWVEVAPPLWAAPYRRTLEDDSALQCGVLTACGWPFPAMTKANIGDCMGCGFSDRNFDTMDYGVPVIPGRPTRFYLPGFFADTALFGAAWFALLAAPLRMRTSLRRRRGLCPKCAYDLNRDFAAGCSECGWNRAKGAAK